MLPMVTLVAVVAVSAAATGGGEGELSGDGVKTSL